MKALIFAVGLLPLVATAGQKIDEQINVPASKRIFIDNQRGDVRVEGWDKAELKISGELDDKAKGYRLEVEDDRIEFIVKMPRSGNLGWNTDWTNNFSTGLTATYSGSYNTAQLSDSYKQISVGKECESCEVVGVYVPVYKDYKFESRIMLALNARWEYKLSRSQSIEVSLDISNLLNIRTHSIIEGDTGVEPGRMFWLGLSYNYE